ncbi:MAG: hypothetical protein ABI718_16320, partial [Acidobacteriota bacterium]
MILERQESGEEIAPPADERARRGCRRWVAIGLLAAALIGGIVYLAGSRYLRSAAFADMVRQKVEATLEAHLGRDVTIERVVLADHPLRIVLRNVRVANVPGGMHKDFASARELEIRAGIESFLQRKITIAQIVVRGLEVHFEVYPEQFGVSNNFPGWKQGAPSSNRPIAEFDARQILVQSGTFTYDDLARDLHATVAELSSLIKPDLSRQIYSGVVNSPKTTIVITDFKPVEATTHAEFRYATGALALTAVDLRGEGLQAHLSGAIDPLSEAVYDFRVTSDISLARVRQVLSMEKALSGELTLDGRLSGKQGDFSLKGSFAVPQLRADAYALANLKGTVDVGGQRTDVHIASGRYAGGSLN